MTIENAGFGSRFECELYRKGKPVSDKPGIPVRYKYLMVKSPQKVAVIELKLKENEK